MWWTDGAGAGVTAGSCVVVVCITYGSIVEVRAGVADVCLCCVGGVKTRRHET